MGQHRSLVVAAALLATGCGDDVAGPTDDMAGPTTLARIVVGTFGVLPDDPVLAAPATTFVGEPVTVTVTTFGNTCVSAAGAEVVRRGLEATITPFDQERLIGGCLDVRQANPRPVALSFDHAGEATIRVRGRSPREPGFVTVEASLTVIPLSP